MSGNHCIAAAEHPSLRSDIGHFVAQLAGEQRYFGPSARCAPKPSRALLAGLTDPGGFRLLAVEDDRVVGAVRVDPRGELFVAVLASHRGDGIGRSLTEAAIARAGRLGFASLVLRTTRRATAALRLGEHLGGTLLETDRGQVELVIELDTSPTG